MEHECGSSKLELAQYCEVNTLPDYDWTLMLLLIIIGLWGHANRGSLDNHKTPQFLPGNISWSFMKLSKVL